MKMYSYLTPIDSRMSYFWKYMTLSMGLLGNVDVPLHDLMPGVTRESMIGIGIDEDIGRKKQLILTSKLIYRLISRFGIHIQLTDQMHVGKEQFSRYCTIENETNYNQVNLNEFLNCMDMEM